MLVLVHSKITLDNTNACLALFVDFLFHDFVLQQKFQPIMIIVKIY